MAMASPTDCIWVPSTPVVPGELLEGPARDLGDHVVDGRLEAGRRLAGDVVGDLVERVADGERAAILAIGKPVAFEASADERLTRGFISMTTMSPLAGFRANCTFDPPVSTPTRRMQAKAASRIPWYSTSDSVWAGATVIESPVCTPMGSTFSIEQTTTQLSARSRMTSSSYSFQPAIDFSMRISRMGLASRPPADGRCELLGVVGDAGAPAAQDVGGPDDDGQADASPPPRRASSMVWAMPDGGHREADLLHGHLELRRGPRRWRWPRRWRRCSSTPSRSSTPRSTSSMARFRAVWPPRVGSSGVGPLPLDDLASSTSTVERLDVGGVGEVGVGHDRGRVRVGQDDPVALLAQHPAGLGARVVELAGLADHDRAGADERGSTAMSCAIGHQAVVRHRRSCEQSLEEVAGVVGAGAGLGVVLHAEGRHVGRTGGPRPRRR